MVTNNFISLINKIKIVAQFFLTKKSNAYYLVNIQVLYISKFLKYDKNIKTMSFEF